MEPDSELRSDRLLELECQSTLPGRRAPGRQVGLPLKESLLLWIIKGIAHVRALGVRSVQRWGRASSYLKGEVQV